MQTALTRQVGGYEAQACVFLLGHSRATCHWTGVMEKQGVEPARHGWGLDGGQVQQVGDKDGLQQAEHHQGQTQGKVDTWREVGPA